MTVYENNRPQPDIQSVFKEYLQLSNGLLDDFKNDDALIEISLTKTESQDLKIISLIGLLSKPIPISRIKKIYLSSELAKTDVLSTAQSTDAGVIPYFLINGYITVKLNQFNEIKGLQCIENFITDKEHNEIMNAINNSGWLSDLKRRVQHYGYKYDYKKRSLGIVCI